ncbi:hypothetical protein chiPu_0032516, partial [Chiloscyllium punctatum]|nr:hypothetical protein [Chiloscyllium punctatum]
MPTPTLTGAEPMPTSTLTGVEPTPSTSWSKERERDLLGATGGRSTRTRLERCGGERERGEELK